MKRIPGQRWLVLGWCAVAPWCARGQPEAPLANSTVAETPAVPVEFSVMVYNVENLFDADGVALFEDYQPGSGYNARQLWTKLRNLREGLKAYGNGTGPEVVLFQEFEGDQTPGDWSGELAEVPGLFAGRTVESVLTGGEVPGELRGLPAYVWAWQTLQEAGMDYGHVASAEYAPPPPGENEPAHANAVFSRFPIVRAASHPLEKARSILEVEVEVAGARVLFLDNHWKSGASDPATEPVRIGNARVLRRLLEERLSEDRWRDVVLGGDFNSLYNQSERFPEMPATGINTVLGSQGDELALQREGGALLYNLWYDLPPQARGSEVHRGQWGTLMQMLVTPGLYDRRGIQYVDNSFGPHRVEGLNVLGTGIPRRWVGAGEGAGCSDHLPVVARFRVVPSGEGWMELVNPGKPGPQDDEPVVLDLSRAMRRAPDLATAGGPEALRNPDRIGELFRVEGTVKGQHPLVVETAAGDWEVWIPDRELRERVMGRYGPGKKLRFTGELGWFKGRWQFVIPEESWLN